MASTIATQSTETAAKQADETSSLTGEPAGSQKNGIQLPSGYVTTERIGSGGYGEVWRATAPGGVEKAIKIVYGHCSDDLAERELKSLERIRQVRHPFVISLERFEVLDGRLIIVTELADMSLDACFKAHQANGLVGVPREELLRYLHDAADALDCLVDQHSLQHLDIKPENLLVVGDHVKVGDFGLVKELANRTLDSMMGGMTPLYSAPEVFDDQPSKRSDQYSLAIVFQQMLTGQLPFPGRTPAQLAKQHTQAEPNLQPLVESDRTIIRRALAKRPEARFASCRELVAALEAGRITPPPKPVVGERLSSANASADASGSAPYAAMKTEALAACKASESATQPKGGSAQDSADTKSKANLSYPTADACSQVVDVETPDTHAVELDCPPTLLVAIGGMGAELLQRVRQQIGDANPERLSDGLLAWLAIDTDRQSLNEVIGAHSEFGLPADDALHTPLKRPKQYGDASQNLLGWVSRRWLYNIPRSLETRGYRPLGRIAAVDHAEPILRSLYHRLNQLSESNPGAKRLRVVFLAGASGGTGGGALIDIAQASRSLSRDLDVELQIDSVLILPERPAGVADSLPIANAYSLLTELAHSQQHGNVGESSPHGPAARFESQQSPFDDFYVVVAPPRTDPQRRQQAQRSIVDYLALDTTPAAALLSACRRALKTDSFRLRTFGCVYMTPDDDPGDLLTRLNASALDSSHRRMTLLLSCGDCLQGPDLVAQRPTTRVIDGWQGRTTLVAEGADLAPLTLATRLAEHYPDIAEAAERLFTRKDINWQDLRLNGAPD
ncbi:Tubulin-like protein [Posidoniimonas polymericola]|uniref:Tubulin-like protein n=1 Tax=Posidoniimonas polymericola TaxID=2528002 RepID=A0A5C5XYY8_9BACT|nr:tubulin-like doman-containing protein [Posidoniimonas polymericola]TWT67759.1 Tubulin-like protein [Posidoniimonas polymericola]